MIAMIRPKPSDPRVSMMLLVFSSIPPKKGTSLPNNMEINIATATINPRNLVTSHKSLDNLFIASIISLPLSILQKERGFIKPLSFLNQLITTYTFP